MPKKRVTLSTTLLLFISTICTASEFSQGAYIGGSIGYGETALDRPQQVTTFKRDGYTWSVLAGYKFSKIISTEIGYYRMHNVKASGVINGSNVSDTAEPSFTYIALKGELKIISRLSGYGKFGLAYSYGKEKLQIDEQNTTRSQGKVVPYIAAGIEYNLNNKVSSFFDVSNTFKKGQVPRLTSVSIGIRYNFGEV
jgi:predicted porin